MENWSSVNRIICIISENYICDCIENYSQHLLNYILAFNLFEEISKALCVTADVKPVKIMVFSFLYRLMTNLLTT